MINFGEDVLASLTQEIWESMLDIRLQPDINVALDTTSSTGSPRADGDRLMSACVQVAGAWSGAVRLDCSQRFARKTAAAFLATEESEVSREQMLDAVGEVTNMITGSVKRLLPAPCHISIPSVVDGTEYQLNIRKGKRLLESCFVNGGERLKVSLFEADAEVATGGPVS